MKPSSEISLKKANFSDIEFLWYLRNQPGVYKYSRQNRAVSWKEHIGWILPIILGVSNKKLFIVKNLQTPIGQIRLDYQDQSEAEISISISKEFQGKGFATKSLNLAIKKAKKQKRTRRIIAEIHRKNLPSVKLFEKLNFKFKAKREDWLKYTLELEEK